MTVRSTKEYVGVPRDVQANFNGNQIVFVCWEQHLLFAAPFMIVVPPEMKFLELVAGPLSGLMQPDPDAAAVKWEEVEWLKSNQPFRPDFNASISENGIGHKEQLRFRSKGKNTFLEAAI